MRVQSLVQTYPSPIDDVWDALTSADRIGRWFLPVSGDLQLGGHYQFEGNAGGTVQSLRAAAGRHRELQRHLGVRRLGATWVTVRLEAVGADATRLELEHVAPVAIDSG